MSLDQQKVINKSAGPSRSFVVVAGDAGGFEYYVDDEAAITYAIQRAKLDYIEVGPARSMTIYMVSPATKCDGNRKRRKHIRFR
jgi:hypothetical protein